MFLLDKKGQCSFQKYSGPAIYEKKFIMLKFNPTIKERENTKTR